MLFFLLANLGGGHVLSVVLLFFSLFFPILFLLGAATSPQLLSSTVNTN